MIWLVGNKGMLGTELELILRENQIDLVGTDKEISITDYDMLKVFSDDLMSKSKKLSWIINCAAYTMVDKAEDETEECYGINVLGPKNLALLACTLDVSLLHISTDYVFSGDTNCPYTEESPRSPICVYGSSKAEGEEVILAICKRSLIIRTAWLYGRYGRNFVYTMLKLMNEREEVGVVEDQRGSPTWTKDLAKAIAKIILSENIPYGIYHYTNEGECSWFEFAQKIYELGKELGLVKRDSKIKAIKTCDYKTKAKRPLYSVLSKEKIKHVFNLEIPHWEYSLNLFLQEIAKDGQVF